MQTIDTIERWRERISHWPYPEKVKSAAIDYAHRLHVAGFPVVFEFLHLANEIGVSAESLADVVRDSSAFYREFQLPKRRGGSRTIAVPSPVLMQVQRWLLSNVLERIDVGPWCYGFVKGRSVLDNARMHVGCAALLGMDLADFFPSIGIKRVIRIFTRAGYAPKVAYYMAACCCLRGVLPQGAATSPYISNLVAKRLDARIAGYCRKRRLTYSRYADDLSISGRAASADVAAAIARIVREEGFQTNEAKTRLARGREMKIVTGLSVGGRRIALLRKTKRELRQEVHFLRKFGYFEHVARRQVDGDLFYLDRLRGRLAFWRQVEDGNPQPIDLLIVVDEADRKLKGLASATAQF